ncbi:MAG: Flp family type IVb pilin [Methylobacterium sp.]|nr:Flp family type IVb pilin [Methylobacterium sp.]
MKQVLKAFVQDERGATAIEYTLIAVMLCTALLAGWPGFYEGFMASWTNAGEVIQNAVKAP